MSVAEGDRTGKRTPRTIRVLHLASFSGNVGDNANHSGTRPRLAANFGPDVSLVYTDLEIRQFYRVWNDRSFDQALIDQANDHDLFLIGGGNYFELWVDHSRTGTTVDLPPELLDSLSVPTVFYGLGLDPEKGYSNITLERFKAFLDHVLSRDRFLVSVRNDGSMEAAETLLGRAYADRLHKVPDGGFFVQAGTGPFPELLGAGRSMVLNLAGDMLERRFAGAEQGIGYSEHLDLLARMAERLLRDYPDLVLVLACHIHRDLHVAAEFVNRLDDRLARSRVRMAPYLNGPGAERHIFGLYAQAGFTLGNRFHANVCPIGLGVPGAGLANYPKIAHLYRELGLPERCVPVHRPDFADMAEVLARQALDDPAPVRRRYRRIAEDLSRDVDAFQLRLRDWYFGLGR